MSLLQIHIFLFGKVTPLQSHMDWLRLVGSLKIIGLFCRISSFLLGSFPKETYNFKEPTSHSHPIPSYLLWIDGALLRMGMVHLRIDTAVLRITRAFLWVNRAPVRLFVSFFLIFFALVCLHRDECKKQRHSTSLSCTRIGFFWRIHTCIYMYMCVWLCVCSCLCAFSKTKRDTSE